MGLAATAHSGTMEALLKHENTPVWSVIDTALGLDTNQSWNQYEVLRSGSGCAVTKAKATESPSAEG